MVPGAAKGESNIEYEREKKKGTKRLKSKEKKMQRNKQREREEINNIKKREGQKEWGCD